MAVLGKIPPAISPLSTLPAKRPQPMTQTPADPAASAGDAADAAAAPASAEQPPAATAIVTPTQTLRKTASTTSVLSDKAPDTPGSSTSSTAAPRQRKYERKTKRFIWPDELHRLFVAAIFDVGLKNASPKALLALMGSAGPNAGLTTEHLKSHLQKYRLNYERSRQEFLDFYDQSAKKNLKRRRKQASRSGEHNTMFVFPIVPNNKRTSDDESGDEADESMSMSDSTQSEQPTPRDSINDKDRASFSEFLQRAERAKPPRVRSASMQPTPSGGVNGQGSPQDRRAVAPTHSYGGGAPKRNIPGYEAGQVNNRGVVAGIPYYTGGVPVSGPGGMNVMTDPQWNLLNSMMMSPHLVGSILGNPNASQQGSFPTSEAMAGVGVSASESYNMPVEEPTDLQMQMHMAMQAHMSLHRQMLTRKVEVSQHATAAQVAAATNATYGHQQLQQQQQWASRQMQTQRQQQQQPSYQPPTSAGFAPEQSQGRRSTSMQQSVMDASPPLLAIMPRPAIGSSSMTSAPTSEPTISTQAMLDEVMAEDTSTANLSSSLEARTEDESMDLYRWDRIDLNVDLDDDDLFGFLKS